MREHSGTGTRMLTHSGSPPNTLLFYLGAELVVEQRLQVLGVALDCQDDGPFLNAVGGVGNGGDDLPAVGQAEAQGEGAVGPELDRHALERDMGIRFCRAIDNEFGIKLEPELTLTGGLHEGAGARSDED